MGWNTVIKTINGNSYLYRQRSYRDDGKVKTETQYIGQYGSNAPRIHISENTTPWNKQPKKPKSTKRKKAEPKKAASIEHVPNPTLRMMKSVRYRTDISEFGISQEHYRIEKLMSGCGINSEKLKPIRIWSGRRVRSVNWFTGYFVMGPPMKNRVAFRREIRRTHAKRWLDGLKKQNRKQYKLIKSSVSKELRKVPINGNCAYDERS